MKATDLLESHHKEVKKLFNALEKSDDRRERRKLLTTIASKLAAHMVIEQEIFYPAFAKRLGDKDMDIVAEAFEEHGVASLQLTRVLESKAGDVTFKAKAKVLQELIEHHIEEEEGEMFRKARRAFDASELEELGEQMEARFESQLEEGYAEVLAEPPPDARDAMAIASRGATRTSKTTRAAAKKPGGRRTKR